MFTLISEIWITKHWWTISKTISCAKWVSWSVLIAYYPITWDQALFLVCFVFFFLLLCFFGSRGKKSNAWYIYLTSSQPPLNLHNLTSTWPVMLLANKRLPYGNQILARMMSLLKSILGKRKFLSTSMFRWRFLKKKNLMCCFCDEILLAGGAVPLFNSYKW